jgi:hypothetical protein
MRLSDRVIVFPFCKQVEEILRKLGLKLKRLRLEAHLIFVPGAASYEAINWQVILRVAIFEQFVKVGCLSELILFWGKFLFEVISGM